MRPFALVEIEGGSESDSRVLGNTDTDVLVVDWDMLDLDPASARDMIEEIKGRYAPGESTEEVAGVLARLEEIVSDFEEANEDEDDEDDDEDLDDDDEFDLDPEDEDDEG